MINILAYALDVTDRTKHKISDTKFIVNKNIRCKPKGISKSNQMMQESNHFRKERNYLTGTGI